MFRVGNGFDVHKLGKDRDFILGGVKIEHHLGLVGHSDADVLVHSIMDGILGALALGDIGKHFPDTDLQYKGVSSLLLLQRVAKILTQNNYKINNIDSTVACQQPKLAPYLLQIRENIAKVLKIQVNQISVKATTTEKLGFEGREEGVSAYAVVLLTSL